MESAARGTVTNLAAEYPPDEAKKASERIQDSISTAHAEIDRLRGFVSDNANLISLVQRLPESLHHDVMVPLGKSAFFPGRMVHTNEFLVLLGEGYYADATAKQTLEILRRRGKSLESQLSSVNAVVQDLQAEATFFSKTASELAEDGIFEIREEYVEESSEDSVSEPGPVEQVSSEEKDKKTVVEEEEFARIMARFDELEIEELKDESEQIQAYDIGSTHIPEYELKDNEPLTGTIKDQQHHHDQGFDEELNCTGLTTQPMPEGGLYSHGNTFTSNTEKFGPKSMVATVLKDKVQVFTSSPSQTPEPSFDSGKAFTGSIVERADNLKSGSQNHTPSQTYGSQTSKPVSRFKMMRK